MDKLRKVCNKAYPVMMKGVPILNQLRSTNPLHNKERLKYYPASRKTFDGNMQCGAASYMLSYYMDQHNFVNTLTKKTKGVLSSYSDHTFIQCQHLIVDPTYRQMFLPNTNRIDLCYGTDPYYEHLFTKLPYVFIGTDYELSGLYLELNELHKKVYEGDELENKLDMWQDGEDISLESDCDKVVENIVYAYEKGSPFIKLHIMMNNSI
jgi:hypothetical protein